MGNRLMSLSKRKKRKKEGATYTVEWDDDLTEFPLDEGRLCWIIVLSDVPYV